MKTIAIIQVTAGSGLTLIPTEGDRLDEVFSGDLRPETCAALDRALVMLGEDFVTVQAARGGGSRAAALVAELAALVPDVEARKALVTATPEKSNEQPEAKAE